jgi:hypothetical protein
MEYEFDTPEKGTYHSGHHRLSSSGAKEILKSPAHFMMRYGPNARRTPPTAAMRFGTAVHTLVLEGEEAFKDTVLCRPDGLNTRTKAGKAELEAMLEAHPNISKGMVFSTEDYDAMFWMRDAVYEHPMASDILSEGLPEYYYEWTDPGTSAKCKALADWYAPHCIADLKTCIDASPEGFAKAVFNFNYHLSAEFYRSGDEVLNEGEIKNWYWIAVEKHTFQVAVYTPDEVAERIGRRKVREALKRFAVCHAENRWDSYSKDIQELISPRWAR